VSDSSSGLPYARRLSLVACRDSISEKHLPPTPIPMTMVSEPCCARSKSRQVTAAEERPAGIARDTAVRPRKPSRVEYSRAPARDLRCVRPPPARTGRNGIGRLGRLLPSAGALSLSKRNCDPAHHALCGAETSGARAHVQVFAEQAGLCESRSPVTAGQADEPELDRNQRREPCSRTNDAGDQALGHRP